MILIPAIDIKDGQCVRLRQGQLADPTVYSDNPVSQAKRWAAAGATRIHIVDLDGAVQGHPVNAEIIGEIVHQTQGVEIQVGGGIRSLKMAQSYLDFGVAFAIVGTRAVNNPKFVAELSAEYPGQVIAGIDVRDGAVATDGWMRSEQSDVAELATELESYGAAAIVYTDIERDGMLSGVNAESTAILADSVSIPVFASGGIKDLNDIRSLLNFNSRIAGAIAGKSLYEGSLDFARGLELIRNSQTNIVHQGDR